MTLRLLLAPVPAILIGVVVMIQGGVLARAWGLDIATMVVGAALALATRPARASRPANAAALAVVTACVAFLAATLVYGGVDGVRRWVAAGPLQLHAAAIVLPPILVFLPLLARSASLGVALVTLCILWLQPDATQAGAFAVAWSVGEWSARGRASAVPIGVAMLLAVSTSFRADPLPPVAHVEGILGLATRQWIAWGVFAALSLMLPPLAWLRSSGPLQGAVLACYITITLLAPWFGNFPVPYLGYGVSPIIGYYLAVAGARWLGNEAGIGIRRLV